MLVADAGHDEVVELDRRRATSYAASAASASRTACACCPPSVAAEVGYDVVVADTVHHQLRGIALATGEVRVLAGDGAQWMQGDGADRLSSPWDVAWWQDRVWVAMAGIHQLWTFDPRTGDGRGGRRHHQRGPARRPGRRGVVRADLRAGARTATGSGSPTARRRPCAGSRPAGRAVGAHRRRAPASSTSASATAPADQALLQHPLGVTVLPDGSVAVCDTYNGAVRRYDPATGEVTTLAADLAEPSGAYVDGRPAGRRRVRRAPADPGAARGRRRRAPTASRTAPSARSPTWRPSLELVVSFEPPPGQKVDDRFGPPSQLVVEATPPALIRDGDGRGTDLTRTLVLDPQVGEGVLHVAARAASCDVDGGEGAACRMHQQDWGVPVRVSAGGERVLVLPLGGADVSPRVRRRVGAYACNERRVGELRAGGPPHRGDDAGEGRARP